jgi:5-methylcytosine-specific restriction endonuclease McrA
MQNGNGSTKKPGKSKLNKDVLILTRAFQPVEITTVKNAMTLLCGGKAKALDKDWQQYTFEEWVERHRRLEDESVVKTVRNRIEIPDVLILTTMEKPPKYNVKFSYQNIITRDKFICQYCSEVFERKDLTVDHVLPKSKGGKSTWENCVAACFNCNTVKADKTEKWKAKI